MVWGTGAGGKFDSIPDQHRFTFSSHNEALKKTTTVQEVDDLCTKMKKIPKTFLKHATYKAIATALNEVKAFRKEVKEAIEKKEKEDAKQSAANDHKRSQILNLGPGKESVIFSSTRSDLKTRQSTPDGVSVFGVKWDLRKDILDQKNARCLHPVMTPSQQMKSIVSEIKSMDYYASQKDWTLELMKERGLQMTDSKIIRPPALRAVKAALKNLGFSLLPHTVGRDYKDLSDVFDPFFTAIAASGAHLLTYTNYCMMDVRVVLEGSCYVLGIRADAVAGDTTSEKQSAAAALTAAAWAALSKDNGFCVKCTAESLIVVPANHILLFVNMDESEVCHGLHWTITPSTPVTQQSVEMLKACLGEQPDKKHGTHGLLLKYLESRVALA